MIIKKPLPGEYPTFGEGYVNLVPEGDVIALLERLKDSSYELFYNLSDEKANYAYAEGKWTVKQALGHMIDTERTFAYRLLYISRQTIELPGFDQDIFVNNAHFNDSPIQDLAAEFRATRESNLYLFRALTDEQMMRTGVASGFPVSVRGLLYLLAGHEMYHLDLFKKRYSLG